MSEAFDLRDARRALELLARAMLRPHAPAPRPVHGTLLVDVARQEVWRFEGDKPITRMRASTAEKGIGGAAGSNRTPPGWLEVHARIGADAHPDAIFESREDTGERWMGGDDPRDLILTRVVTLDGLEPGINQGPGCDARERYIYFHGTNHEDQLGMPASHGCVRLSRADAIALAARVRPGDRVAIVEDFALPADPRGLRRFHYAGVGGSGMSALAQFQVMSGGRASGSDRGFDRGERAEARAHLESLGIGVTPQDGSGIGDDCAALVVSTAVEEQVPDVAAARARRLPVIHRSELLAHFVADRRTIAVSGTSGKSSVVAMIFEILRGAGRDPSVITGGDLVALQREGLWGNAWAGQGDLLVIEADESDGSLVRYAPAVGVILNLQKDHKEMSEVAAMFATFRTRTLEGVVVGEAANLDDFARGPAMRFGLGDTADVRGREVALQPAGSAFMVERTRFTLPVPGAHNVENALAAIAACRAVGLRLADMVAPLAAYAGVGRRFQSLGMARGIEVVDDFAHNPAKIAAALATAQARAGRVLAIYQPHGYGPTRFLRPDFVETFATSLRPADRAWWLEVFYAGGTATRDFSAADIVAEIAARGAIAEFAPSREWLLERIAAEARAGDLVLVMGARDPSLTQFARALLDRLGEGAT